MGVVSEATDDDIITYPTGARGSKDATGYRYDLISPIAMERLAKVCHEGAVKYGDRDWEKGLSVAVCICRAIRHLYKYLRGDRSEDHLGHALWRIAAAAHSEEAWPHLNQGTPPKGD